MPKPIIYVDEYFAKLPKGTEDSVVIQAAINDASKQGAEIIFGARVYNLNKQVVFRGFQSLTVSGTIIDAANRTVIRAKNTYQKSTAAEQQEGILEFKDSSNVVVEKLFIKGNSGNTTGVGDALAGVSGQGIPLLDPVTKQPIVYIHGIYAQSTNSLRQSKNFTVRNNSIVDTVGNGISFFLTDNAVAESNTISAFGHGGIHFERSNNLTARGNSISGTRNKGVLPNSSVLPNPTRVILGTAGILVTGVGANNQGPLENPTKGGLIENNIIRNVPGGGIKVEDHDGNSLAEPFVIRSNQVHAFGKDGIKFDVTRHRNINKVVSNFLIEGNSLSGYRNWRGDGIGYIVVQSARNGSILRNSVQGNQVTPPFNIPDGIAVKYKIQDYESGIWVGTFPRFKNTDPIWERSDNITIGNNNRVVGSRVPLRIEERATNIVLGQNVFTLTIGNDNFVGNQQSESFDGSDGNDTLTGGRGNDFLIGNKGDDILTGVLPTQATPQSEIDTLTGGAGSDTFVLGNNTRVFYDDLMVSNSGGGSYALIRDLTDVDSIQLKGGLSYLLGAAPTGLTGVGLYVDNDGVFGKSLNDELIAVISNRSLAQAETISRRFVFA